MAVTDFLRGLNPAQHEAASTTEGPVLILAGAGSGKTKVITCRVAHLLQRGVAPHRILAVSFTNKAAQEMRDRVRALCGKQANDCLLSTFHAFGVRFLREEHAACGLYPGFSILDEADQHDAVRVALRSLGFSTEQYEPRAIHQRIGHYKNLLQAPSGRPMNPLDGVVGHVLPLYQQRLRAMNGCDFDDLIGLPVLALEKDPEVSARWADRFRYVMVDEYQDTNAAQLRLLKALVRGSGNLCVVGDDDQSIYAWRGAVAGNILRFGETFQGARVIPLTQNYRSTNAVLRCANAVISNNPQRHEKSLWSERGDGERVRYQILDNDEEEARWVATDVLKQRATRKLAWRDIGILYRTNAQSRIIEDEIRKAGIPYRIIGGTRFYDRKEIRDVVAWLRIIANGFDEAAYRRAIATPPRGVGDASIERLAEWAKARSVPFFRAVQSADELHQIPQKGKDALREMRDLIEAYRLRFETEPLEDVCRDLLDDKRIGFADECVRASKDAREIQRRIDNIRELPSALFEFRKRHELSKLEDFLAGLSLDTRKEEDGDAQRDELSLMTLHGAKGLEFDAVYLLGLEEGLLPHQRVLDGDGAIEEERRLCYVGITRARILLTLSGARMRLSYGKVQRRKISRFIYEIPEALLDGGHGGVPVPDTAEQKEARVEAAFAALDDIFRD
ncbi:MAG: ATP-dependent DNA helicase Rep [Myxococcales bacterium]|nr:ATP-dependent DNA helicase Rep [Myxococcales bacterium]